MKTNNFRLLANGIDIFGGVDFNDGQGGGGAGGTVVLQIGQITGSLACELKGGRGGSNPYTPDFQLHGPGGGGGGGKLLLTQNSPNVISQLQGGMNGLTSQNFTNGAFPGEMGKMLSGFQFPEDVQPAHPVSDHLVLALQSPLCAGSLSGQIAVLQSTALTFRINGGPWQNDSIFTGLGAGFYTLSLRFSGGCSLDTTAVLVAPPPVRDSWLAITDASCFSGGMLQVMAVSGTAPYEYQLDNGAWQSSGTFPNLPAANYAVTVRDAGGCTKSSSYAIGSPAAPQDSLLMLVPASCTAGGSITVIGTTGTAPFEYQANGGPWQFGGTFTNLPASTYTITLRDAAGCTTSSDYEVPPPTPLLDSLLVITPASCLAGGSIQVTAISGTSPFEFQANGGPWQSGGTFTGLAAGNYTIILRDAAGCTLSGSYGVPAPLPPLDSLLSDTPASCLTSGAIIVTAVAGTGPFEFQLNGEPWQPSGNFTDLPPGNYTVILRDAAGCTHSSNYAVAAPPAVLDSLLA
ncbi:MAG: hypothetical protein ABIO24_13715, partial [Saprospiraceae bacterium]